MTGERAGCCGGSSWRGIGLDWSRDGIRQAAWVGSVANVGGLVPLRPVAGFCGKVGTRLTREKRCDVERIGIAQRIGLAEWHVGLDEASRVAQAGHPGPDVERLRTPERRKQVRT